MPIRRSAWAFSNLDRVRGGGRFDSPTPLPGSRRTGGMDLPTESSARVVLGKLNLCGGQKN